MNKYNEELIKKIMDATVAIEDFYTLSEEDQQKTLNTANMCMHVVLQCISEKMKGE
jgi:hypothetical protein